MPKPGPDKALCGAKTSRGTCRQVAGARTDHLGVGCCWRHGGSTPTHERSASLVIARQECEKLGIEIETDPGEALIRRLWEAEGDLAFYRAQVQTLGEDVLTTEWSVAEGRRSVPNAMVVLYHEAETRSVQIAAAAIRANVDERRVRLAERDAGMIFAAVAAALKSMGLADRFEEFRHAFAAALDSQPAEIGAA